MTNTPEVIDMDVVRAADSGRAIYHAPDEPVMHEPAGPDECIAAVSALAACFAQAGGTVSAIVTNARAAAQVLSGDRLQGVSEIVQNADDAAATYVRFYQLDDELLAVHDGRPLTLSNVHALAAPWLTTKREEASATGRFGIGLLTLHALSPVFEIHGADYHLRLGDPTLESIDEPTFPSGLVAPHETALRVPLQQDTLASNELLDWSSDWDDSSLLFLQSVRRVSFNVGGVQHELHLTSTPHEPIVCELAGSSVSIRRSTLEAPDGRSWAMHQADVESPPGLTRAHKRTEQTTPVGVAVPLDPAEVGGYLYAGLRVAATHVRLRANAQFDPIASRQNFADSAWNSALAELVADLWSIAVLDAFKQTPAAAWALVPLPGEIANIREAGDLHLKLVDQVELLVASKAGEEVARSLLLPIDSNLVSIAEVAVESAELEGLLTAGEIADLAGLEHALPNEHRDTSGRWREVLASWRSETGSMPAEITIADAIALTEEVTRDPANTVALLAAAVDAGLAEELAALNCLVLADGSRTSPPNETHELRVLTLDRTGLAALLGVADHLHGCFQDNSVAASTVRIWLQESHTLVDGTDNVAVLEMLAAAGGRSVTLGETLSDAQIVAVRDALEPLGQTEWDRLGAGIGQAIRLQAVTFNSKGKPEQTTSRPADAYQPKTIDREIDSFGVAAECTPGLFWIAPRYAKVLRSSLGRAGLGTQRFLRLLGAETGPRLAPHPSLIRRYSDPRRGLSAQLGATAHDRRQALSDLQARYSLDDCHSPDLQAVLHNIALDRRATRRRRRASALLAVLGRAWPSLSDYAQVTAAHDYSGWQLQGSVRAWWLWAAGSVAWLDSAAAVPTPPRDLRLRTAAALAVYGDHAESFLHPAFKDTRPDVLAALGVAGEPDTRKLVTRLTELRDAGPAADTASEAAIAYQALSERMRQTKRVSGHLTPSKLRQLFSAAEGLILTTRGWLPPAEVLRGPPVFGDHRAFVPQIPGTDDLWANLQVRTPDLDDCLDVIRDIARQRRSDLEIQTVVLDVLRLMVKLLDKDAGEERQLRRLQRLALFTSQGWTTQRPAYAVEDPSLAAGIGDRLPVWNPGGELGQFETLVAPLRLVEITAEDAPLVGADISDVDEDASALFRDAVRHLREDLARNDPESEASLRIAWADLEDFDVRVTDDLRVSLAAITQQDLVVRVMARVSAGDHALYVTDSDAVSRVDSGGRAVASMFRADPRRLSQAWLAAVDAAREGREAARLQLAVERAADESAASAASIQARLEQVREQVQDRTTRRDAGKTGNRGRVSAPGTKPPGVAKTGESKEPSLPDPRQSPPLRTLVDLSTLVVVDPDGVIVKGSRVEGSDVRKRKLRGPLPEPRSGGAVPRERATYRAYTDLEKESLGLELARRVLSSDRKDMIDLRAQHGLGADALDELKQFYEFKVSAGSEPDEIVLEDSQIRRALSTNDFFLVVVSGLEGEKATPKVRIIVNPLGQLRMSEKSQIRYSGIRQSQSLVYYTRAIAEEDREAFGQQES